jgi:predicted DNA-binding protein
MNTTALKNCHIPLPNNLYSRLKKEAKQSKQPVTKLVRYAVESWLEQQQSLMIEEELTKYVNSCAGSKHDLDPDLEAASIDHLINETSEF